MAFTRTFNTRAMTPNELTAALRAADVEASAELGGAITRSKTVDDTNGVMTVVWGLMPGASSVSAPAPSGTLAGALERGADVIAAAVPVAKAVVEGRRLSKLSALADRMSSTVQAWDARADKIMAGVLKLEPMAESAFTAHETKLAEAEAGFKSMQDAVRDLTGGNGGSAA